MGLAGRVALERPFSNNPDLAERIRNDCSLSPDLPQEFFYTAGGKRYADYSVYKQEPVEV